jgi:hypothetical protein
MNPDAATALLAVDAIGTMRMCQDAMRGFDLR